MSVVEKEESTDAATQPPNRAPRVEGLAPRWQRLLAPSFFDIIFVFVAALLLFTMPHSGILDDSDTGWHIRNGEAILANHALPHVDPFSYTMAGKPWFAWEWLADIGLGFIHGHAGLLGVTVVSALIMALALALEYKLAEWRSGNAILAIALTLISAGAAFIHRLARPHILSWVLLCIFLIVLERFRTGRSSSKSLWLLPALMVLWTNLHGSFPLGIIVMAVFLAGEWVNDGSPVKPRDWRGTRSAKLAVATVAASLATLVNPYGYQLHVHIVKYLRNSFLIDNTNEFASPDFHVWSPRCFLLLIVIALIGLAGSRRRAKLADIVLAVLAIAMALAAARNLPTSAILLTFAAAPYLEDTLRRAWQSDALNRLFAWAPGMCDRTTAVQKVLYPGLFSAAFTLFSLALLFTGGRAGGKLLIDARMSEKFPAQAADYIKQAGIHDHLFTFDQWGGYLIYRLSPDFKVFIDGRGDFYSSDLLHDYMRFVELKPGWKAMFDKYSVRYILLPADTAHSEAIAGAPGWTLVYHDKNSVLFQRNREPQP